MKSCITKLVFRNVLEDQKIHGGREIWKENSRIKDWQKKETSSTQEHLKSDDEEARIREKMPQGSLEKEGISR